MNTVERIIELLEKHNMTAKEYSEKLGLNKGVVTGWKAGKAKPTADIIKITAELFDVSTDYLMCLIDDPASSKKLASPEYLKKLKEIPAMHFHLLKGIEGLDLSERDVDFLIKIAKEYDITKKSNEGN